MSVAEQHFNTARSSFSDRHYAVVTNQLKNRNRDTLYYYSYKIDVISSYCHAVEALGAHAHCMDVDDYVRHCQSSGTPFFDGTINLGSFVRLPDLDGLIPSLSALAGIPVFPCTGSVNLIAEDKLLAKMAARYVGLQCAPTISSNDLKNFNDPVIVKPVYGGDSVNLYYVQNGTQIGELACDAMAEPYIDGFDVTVITAWCPWLKRTVLLGAEKELVSCGAEGHNVQTNEIKAHASDRVGSSPTRKSMAEEPVAVTEALGQRVCALADALGSPLYARTDFRVKAPTDIQVVDIQHAVFLEINSMPTLGGSRHYWWTLVSRHASLNGLDIDDALPLPKNTPDAVKAISFFLTCWKFRDQN